MKITVTHVNLNEDMEIMATVSFWDDLNSPHFRAEVTVYIDNRDRLISELKTGAIEKARAFLSQILSFH